MQSKFNKCYNHRYLAEDLAAIRSLKQRIQNGETIVIQDSEINTLQRMLDALQKEDFEICH